MKIAKSIASGLSLIFVSLLPMTTYAIDYEILYAFELTGTSKYIVEVKRTDVPKGTPNRCHWLLIETATKELEKLNFISMGDDSAPIKTRKFVEGVLWFDLEKGTYLPLGGVDPDSIVHMVRLPNDKTILPGIVSIVDSNLQNIFNLAPAGAAGH